MREARMANVIGLGIILLATACSSGGTNPDGSPRPRSSRNVITAAELADVSVTNAYDAIQRLRSSWFQTRGVATGSSSTIRLYVDGVNAGDIERLRTISIDRVTEMRRISSSDATTRWGTGHPQGAIEIITRR